MILTKIQSELKAPKGQVNSFGKYKYRSCEDIVEAAKPVLAKHSCWLNITDDIVLVGDRYYVKATASIMDESGSILAHSSAFAREPLSKKGMDDSQITGTASSYARKYALNGLLAIDDTKDADTMDNSVDEAMERLKKAISDHKDTIAVIKEGIATGELHRAAEAWFELSKEEMASLWVAPTKGGPFTTAEREVMKSTEFREANFNESEAES